jgi:hypothetical protein
MNIAIIGAGVSGIAAGHCMIKAGHDVVLYEKSGELGGVWALGYPDVRLQNTGYHYRLSDVPWANPPDRHPTSGQIREYFNQAVNTLGLNVMLSHEVTGLEEIDRGWRLNYRSDAGEGSADFDFVIASIGQYSEGKNVPTFPGQEDFAGEIITERDVHDLDVFDGKKVLVAGFGKSALDMATFAVERASEVHHVFRTPRWMIPFRMLGIHYSHLMFCRMGTVMMPSWAQPNRFEAFIHRRLNFLVRGTWGLITAIARTQNFLRGLGKSDKAKRGLAAVIPEHHIIGDLRSAAAMAPERYLEYVADERLLPCHAEIEGFVEDGVRLSNGDVIHCDLVVLSLGSGSPRFPFMPEKYRQLLEKDYDGVQLYRHLIHPEIPNMAFAGFNHGFMHVPAVEVGMLWLSALLDGDLELPSVEEMENSMATVLEWKREHIHFEPSRSCAVNTRFQQYIDILLQDLGLSPYRKLPNVFAEVFGQYGATDYAGIFEEYQRHRDPLGPPRKVLAIDT